MGIERAFPLIGLISGACQRVATLKPMTGDLSQLSTYRYLKVNKMSDCDQGRRIRDRNIEDTEKNGIVLDGEWKMSGYGQFL